MNSEERISMLRGIISQFVSGVADDADMPTLEYEIHLQNVLIEANASRNDEIKAALYTSNSDEYDDRLREERDIIYLDSLARYVAIQLFRLQMGEPVNYGQLAPITVPLLKEFASQRGLSL